MQISSRWALLLIVSAQPEPAAEAPASGAPADACVKIEELQLLLKLREKADQLAKRERTVQMKEEELAKAEKQITNRLGELEEALRKMELRLGIRDAVVPSREKRIITLVDMMNSLPIKKIAPMLEKLDDELAGEILFRLGPAKSAELLLLYPPAQAGRFMKAMAEYGKNEKKAP